jgi:prevent-host-death family protein
VSDPKVSIGRVKRDISELVNRVAFGKERIVLTSRGRPKAVIVGLDDYARLKNDEADERLAGWQDWLANNRRLSADIMEESDGDLFNVDELWAEFRSDLETRHEFLLDD